jgi:hypothetical protein
MSVGLEDVEDLWRDLDPALAASAPGARTRVRTAAGDLTDARGGAGATGAGASGTNGVSPGGS